MHEHSNAVCIPNAKQAEEEKKRLAEYILIDLKKISGKHKNHNQEQINRLLEEALAAFTTIRQEQVTELVGPELFRARFIIRWCEKQQFGNKEEINEYMELFPLMLAIRMAAMGIIRNTYAFKFHIKIDTLRHIKPLQMLWEESEYQATIEIKAEIDQSQIRLNGQIFASNILSNAAGIPRNLYLNNKESCISLHEHGVELYKYIKELNTAASQPIHVDQELSLLKSREEKLSYINGYLEGEALIKKADKEFFAEIKVILDGITLLTGGRFVGCSDVWYQGYAFFNPDHQWTPITYADHLIHETAHIRLHAVNELNTLLENGDEPGKSPIRVDARPLYGILHSTFVFMRLVLFFQKLAEIQEEEEEIMFRLHRHLKGFYEGMQELHEKARWTEAGNQLFYSMCTIRAHLIKEIGSPQEKFYANIGNDYVL